MKARRQLRRVLAKGPAKLSPLFDPPRQARVVAERRFDLRTLDVLEPAVQVVLKPFVGKVPLHGRLPSN
ncbi:MAG: hypothetical protein ACYTFI_06665 [Planctomycetota bacterium]